jgi:succinate dehydrogenase / fumarate reductase membrane anchor subunit
VVIRGGVIKMENKLSKKPMTSRGTLGTVSWFFQVISGLFLVFFVGVHLYLAHIDFGHPIVFYDSVINNLKNPWWLLFYIAFVWVVTYHGLNGLKGILYDIGTKPRTRKYISYILIAVYIATVIYGTLLAIVVSQIVVP